MNIGYACLALGVPDTKIKSCLLKNASSDRLSELIAYNLQSLENIVDYNIENKIKLFRISSDLIPFGSSPVNNLIWWEIFRDKFHKIGEKIRNSDMRVSMHPGQYTVLNSPNEEVVEKAIKDLDYHDRVLNSLGVNSKHKIILHIGGIYNNKKLATKRFIDNYKRLSDTVRERVVLENDDKSYHINDVFEIGATLNTPVIFDNLHNQINPYDEQMSDYYWINECRITWQEKDGPQKIHYSQQNPHKQPGSHSNNITIVEFMSFCNHLKSNELDIMLEVKDKNLSAIKCINCLSSKKDISLMEREWVRYKYLILEKSPTDYEKIENGLLGSSNEYALISFYKDIDNALQKETTADNSLKAALSIWEAFNTISTDKDTNNFLKILSSFKQGKTSLRVIKNYLWKFAVKAGNKSILNSLYFEL